MLYRVWPDLVRWAGDTRFVWTLCKRFLRFSRNSIVETARTRRLFPIIHPPKCSSPSYFLALFGSFCENWLDNFSFSKNLHRFSWGCNLLFFTIFALETASTELPERSCTPHFIATLWAHEKCQNIPLSKFMNKSLVALNDHLYIFWHVKSRSPLLFWSKDKYIEVIK